MVKIVQYDQQTTANLVGNIAPAPNVSISNPVAAGLGQAGQGINQVAGESMATDVEIARVQKEQQNQIDTLDAGKVGSDAQVQWLQKFQETQRSATGTASGFTSGFLKDYDEYTNKTLENYPEGSAGRRYLQHEFIQQRQFFALKGAEFENTMFTNTKLNNVKDMTQNNAAILAQDPSQYAAMKAKSYAMIDASGLSEIERQKLKEQVDGTYKYTTMNYYLLNNPEAGLNMLRPSVGQLPEGTPQAEVARVARQGGLDPLYALAVGGMESGFDTAAKSKTSTAKGAFQFTDATRKRYGLSENATLQEQTDAFNKLTTDNLNQLRGGLGREPSNQELYLAHHFGGGGANQLLKADKSAPVSQVVDQKVIDANPYMKGKTVGEVIAINNSKYNQEAKKYVDSEKLAVNAHPVIADLSPEERVQYANRLQNEVNTRQQAQAVNLTQTMNDQIAMASTGNMSFTPLSEQQFSAMYPKEPDKAHQAYTQYTGAIQLGRDISMINNMTPAQEMSLVQSYAPKQEQGFAGDLKRQQELLKAIRAKHDAIQKDPAGWAMQNSATVTAAYNKIGTIADPVLKQQAQADYYSKLIAVQKEQGVAYPSLMSRAQEDSIITELQNQKGENKAELLSNLKNQYGKDFQLVARQLQLNKNLPKGLTSIMTAPTPYAAKMAATVADVDIKTLADALPDKNSKDIDDEVSKQLEPFYASMPIGQINSTAIGDIKDTITKLAYNNVRGGMSKKDAVKAASDMFTGSDKYNYISNKSTSFNIRVPKSYDSEVIDNGLRDYIDAITDNDLDTRNLKLLNPWNLAPDARGYVDQVKSNSYWMTNADESGVGMWFTGSDNKPYPVLNKQGQQIKKTFQELTIANPASQAAKLKQQAEAAQYKANLMTGVMR
ncbi:MAG: hypothetical protein E6Q33_02755 [Neisseriales bacterium]|nr:MAG: hypothetical protein E6Q33_02755 [Neisseriales bacterium]